MTKQEIIDLLNSLEDWSYGFATTSEEVAEDYGYDHNELINPILKHSKKIELLEKYSLFLEENGYLDVDWRSEEPFAIDEFLKINK